ncbi:MAG: CHAT domain-containing protein [Gemmatimonadaceae bacterium]
MRALEAELDLQLAVARDEYEAALRSDPTWLPPLFEYYAALRTDISSRALAQFDSIAARATSPKLRHCLGQIARTARGYAPEPVSVGDATSAANDCALMFSLVIRSTLSGCPPVNDAMIRFRVRLADAPRIALHCVAPTTSLEQWRAEQRWAREHQDLRHHPLHRAASYALEAGAWHALGDHGRAVEAEARARTDPAWSRPGFRARYWLAIGVHGLAFDRHARGATPDELRHSAAMIDSANAARRAAADEGDRLGAALVLVDVGLHELNTGNLGRAEAVWKRVAGLAGLLGDDALVAEAQMRLGRVQVKRGATAAAESSLVRARVAVARADSPKIAKEVEHNLLHLFEALGRHADARDAGGRFVHYAAMGGLDQVRMMSARDYGRFLQARGESDSAAVHFGRMLADIDSLGTQFNYAAEYYESRGDLDRAHAYYLRSIGVEEETARVLEGLTRLALAEGDFAEATRLARRHDQRRGTIGRPESAALLPTVLLEARQFGEARDAFDAARRETTARGQTAAWAQLTLDLAEVELALGHSSAGHRLADSARVAAQSVGEIGTAQRAELFSALAQARGGSGRSGSSARRRAAVVHAEIERGGDARLRISARRLAAELHASAGEIDAALDMFARAADLSDSVAEGIALDPDRAGFRSAQRRVYDGALAAIIAERDRPGAAAHFLRWSERRKARALRSSESGDSKLGRPTGVHLPRPSAEEAILDFVLLDTVAAVLVIGPQGASVTRLDTPADSIRAAIGRLARGMRARVGTMLDRSRTRFDVEAARALSEAIITPVIPLLTGIERVMIVPDGALFLVPFDALPFSDPTRAAPRTEATLALLDRFEITQAMTPLGATRPQLRPGVILTLAPGTARDAPGAARELAIMRRAVPEGRLHVFEGARATVAALRAVAPSASVLHFATHAEASAARPEHARVLLAADAGHDGDLAPTEIARLNSAGALVVLSACETAAGRTLEGEGVLSLSRSFLAAGAAATVATLWSVGEHSADFAAEFYPRLVAGESPAAAVRGAKLALRAAGVSAIDWAPYVLFANGAAPVTIAAVPR